MIKVVCFYETVAYSLWNPGIFSQLCGQILGLRYHSILDAIVHDKPPFTLSGQIQDLNLALKRKRCPVTLDCDGIDSCHLRRTKRAFVALPKAV
jgi:hypothetical protein